jgi:uncharacterized membrane protein (DUF2068 family)
MPDSAIAPGHSRPPGLQAIIAYKAAKAALWIALATTLLVCVHFGLTGAFQLAIVRIQTHLTHAWAIELADRIVGAVTPRNIDLAVIALLADAASSVVEAYALFHGKPWGEWLVVVGTAALLPFEVVSLLRHLRISRVLLLTINLAVLAYLVGMIVRRRRAKEGPQKSAD